MSRKTYTIGRAGDITLYDDTVSRRHACLEVEGETLFLRDLESRNGTFEIRDKTLVPFSEGEVTIDQVFAFGECVRSVAQLLKTVEPDSELVAETADEGDEVDVEDTLDQTKVGFSMAPRKRLSATDIVDILERAEDALEAGGTLDDVCQEFGVTVQRYERWCREYGATRHDREQTLVALRRENERLRKLVADLSLEREALKDALRTATGSEPGSSEPAPGGSSVSLSLVGKHKP